MGRGRVQLVALLACGGLLVGCGDGGSTDVVARSELAGTITVSAAASLTDAFTRMVERFKSANPGVEVRFNFDSSSALARQIVEGAPADVFASADDVSMDRILDEDLLEGAPKVFASNELVIVTKPGNPEGITELGDLASAGVIALCGEEAPCGRYAAQVLDDAGVSVPESDVTRGQNATATLTAVTQGDAVAGIVYASDAVRAGAAVDLVSLSTGHSVDMSYSIGVLTRSTRPEVARAFVDHVSSDEARVVLEELGFLPPP